MENRKDIIADIFLSMLSTLPFKQIGIEDIMEQTDFNYRPAFYRLFHDKYALLSYTLNREIKKMTDQAVMYDNYREIIVEFIARYVEIIKITTENISTNDYRMSIVPVHRYLLSQIFRIVEAKCKPEHLSPTETFIVGMSFSGIVMGMTWYDGKLGFDSIDNPINVWLDYVIDRKPIPESSIVSQLIEMWQQSEYQ